MHQAAAVWLFCSLSRLQTVCDESGCAFDTVCVYACSPVCEWSNVWKEMLIAVATSLWRHCPLARVLCVLFDRLRSDVGTGGTDSSPSVTAAVCARACVCNSRYHYANVNAMYIWVVPLRTCALHLC